MENKTINKQIRAVSNRSSLLIIIFLAITIPVRFLFRYLGQNGSDDSLWRNSAFVTFLSYLGLCLVVYPIILLVYYKLLNRSNGLRLKDVFTKSQRSKRWLIKWAVIAMGLDFTVSKIFMFIFGKLYTGNRDILSSGGEAYSNNTLFGWIVYAASLVLIAPIFEELIFRATVFRNNEPVGQMLAAVITGVTFGLWHINVNQIVGASVIGVFLCLIFAKSRSIKDVMLIHCTYNFIVFALSITRFQFRDMSQSTDKEFMIHAMFHNHPIASVCLSLLQLLLCFFYIAAPIMLIVEIIKKRNDFGLNKGDYPCSTAKKALIYLTAPLTIIMYAAVFVMIVILMTE